MRTTAFPVKHRLQNLLSCKIALCSYCLSVQRLWLCSSQPVRVSGADGRQADDPMPVQSHSSFTLTQGGTPVPLVPMTPKKLPASRAMGQEPWTVYLEQRRGSILSTELSAEAVFNSFFSSFVFPLTQANCFFHLLRDILTPENVN